MVPDADLQALFLKVTILNNENTEKWDNTFDLCTISCCSCIYLLFPDLFSASEELISSSEHKTPHQMNNEMNKVKNINLNDNSMFYQHPTNTNW